jgi:hypothetical protein
MDDQSDRMSSDKNHHSLSRQLPNKNGVDREQRTNVNRSKSATIAVDLLSSGKIDESTVKNDLWKEGTTVKSYGDPVVEKSKTKTSSTKKTKRVKRRTVIRAQTANTTGHSVLGTVNMNMNQSMKPSINRNESSISNLTSTMHPSATKGENTLETHPSTSMVTGVQREQLQTQAQQGSLHNNDSIKDMVGFELDIFVRQRNAMNKTNYRLNPSKSHRILTDDNQDVTSDNQGTHDLLEKIRQGVTGTNIGRPAISQQVGCQRESYMLIKTMCISRYSRIVVLNYHST